MLYGLIDLRFPVSSLAILLAYFMFQEIMTFHHAGLSPIVKSRNQITREGLDLLRMRFNKY